MTWRAISGGPCLVHGSGGRLRRHLADDAPATVLHEQHEELVVGHPLPRDYLVLFKDALHQAVAAQVKIVSNMKAKLKANYETLVSSHEFQALSTWF